MIKQIEERKRLAAMSVVSRLRVEHPGVFYASILSLVAGAGVVAFKVMNR